MFSINGTGSNKGRIKLKTTRKDITLTRPVRISPRKAFELCPRCWAPLQVLVLSIVVIGFSVTFALGTQNPDKELFKNRHKDSVRIFCSLRNFHCHLEIYLGAYFRDKIQVFKVLVVRIRK